MKSKFDISVTQLSLENLEKSLLLFNQFIEKKINPAFGHVKGFEAEDLDRGEKYTIPTEETTIKAIGDHYSYDFSYKRDNSFSFIVNKKKKSMAIDIYIKDSRKMGSEELQEWVVELHTMFPLSRGYVRNISSKGQEWDRLVEIDKDTYDSAKFFYVADTSWINIYAPYKIRGKSKNRLLVDDKFYLNIPAYKVEKLGTGGIMVMLFEDPEGSVEEIVKAKKKAIDYYKEQLTRMGLWGHVKWNWPDWKEKYRDFLREKGFEV